MVLKEANWAHNDKIRSNGLERSQLSTQWWSWKNDKIRSDGLERSQLGTQYKIRSNGVERSQLGTQWQKSGHMVLKGVIWVHNDKIRLNGLENTQ